MYQIHRNINSKLDKMKLQRNRFKTKKQDKTPEEEISEMKIVHVPKKEFRVMTIRMIKRLQRMVVQSKKLEISN